MPIILAQAEPPAAAAAAVGPITDPQWAAVPSAAGRNYYPEQAVAQGIGGVAVVECRASPDGRLADCKLLAEQPDHGPFGQAALQIATQFRLKPKTQSGAPVAGRTIRLPMAFRMQWGEKVPAQASMFQVMAPMTWLKKPTGDDMARTFPSGAASRSVEGGATLHCQFQADGYLTACSADQEQPAGEGSARPCSG